VDEHGDGHVFWIQRIDVYVGYVYIYGVCSSYLLVVGDDSVIRYTGAYNITGEVGHT